MLLCIPLFEEICFIERNYKISFGVRLRRRVDTGSSIRNELIQSTHESTEEPSLVYRLQLTSRFTFSDAVKIIPYLGELGVSHLYISPILTARRGSTHCYDVTNHENVNPELGGIAGLRRLSKECEKCKIKMIIDVVPNHMSYSLENPYILDLLTRWNRSKYFRYFDIKENPALGDEKIIFPFISSPARPHLNRRNVELHLKNDLVVNVVNTQFPASLETYSFVSELLRDMKDPVIHSSRREKKENLLYIKEKVLNTDSNSMRLIINHINENDELIERLLSIQHADPVGWNDSSKIINYRRFFAVNNLIALRQEDDWVFRRSHAVLRELSKKGMLWGVRVDHIDGLRNPAKYLDDLSSYVRPSFVVVEKILEPGEFLSRSLEVDGTTGYDFLSYANAFFVDHRKEKEISDIYSAFTGETRSSKTILHKLKLSFIRSQYAGDIDNVSREFYKALVLEQGYRASFKTIRRVITLLAVHLNRYRTFSAENDTTEFVEFISCHSNGNSKYARVIRVIKESLESQHSGVISAMMTLQQYTGTIMAKSLEDTLFFLSNRLISLNEVGWVPWKFGSGLSEFFDFILARKERYPLSFNETSTHDTKLGEDLRSRISVVSGFPEQWRRSLEEVESKILKKRKLGSLDRRHVYYIVQLLAGSIESSNTSPSFIARLKVQVTKAMRESELNTSWGSPSTDYEGTAMELLDIFLEEFEKSNLTEFRKMNEICKSFGFAISLSTQVLKFTLPGSPSMYQGSEVLNLSFTDPDNRREVNFSHLARLIQKKNSDFLLFPSKNTDLNKMKFDIVNFLSHFRAANRSFFSRSNLKTLNVKGKFRENVVAFSRQWNKMRMLVITARYLWNLMEGEMDLNIEWGDTTVEIEREITGSYIDVFTGEKMKIESSLKLQEIMRGRYFAILGSNFKKLE